jgi:catechol 2,3-dioxygenase-like lactoylglutathione lyase family enzyme
MKINPLVPELYVSDFDRSLAFYRDRLGFGLVYMRAEECFAFLEREGAQLMIEQPQDSSRTWLTGGAGGSYGRGINFQIRVGDVETLAVSILAAGISLYLPLEEKWYRRDDELLGNSQFVVEDPDGYLLRFYSDLGSRPVMRV